MCLQSGTTGVPGFLSSSELQPPSNVGIPLPESSMFFAWTNSAQILSLLLGEFLHSVIPQKGYFFFFSLTDHTENKPLLEFGLQN